MSYQPYYFSVFRPFGYQIDALDLLYNYNYSDHTPEILLSGSLGSAKSSLIAHWVLSHCLRNKNAAVGITRMGLPDLKRTLYKEIMSSLDNDPQFIEDKHYKTNRVSAEINFSNGSSIIPVTFGDRDWGKTKSLLLSGMVIEEGTEMDSEFYLGDDPGFKIYKSRLRRAPGVMENFLIIATNPGDPGHYLYDYFIEGSRKYPSRHVFYSLTEENKYLDPAYIKQLKQDLSPLEAERYLRGKWISLGGKGIYAAYDPEHNFRDYDYVVDPGLPVRISFDFNISENKPMSCVLFQFDPVKDEIHYFDESVIDGSYTEDIMTDLYNRGLLNFRHVIIHGDATGKARTTASKLANYDVIRQYLDQYRVTYEMRVPRSNPPIRKRHQLMNAYCHNELGNRRLFVYRKATTANLGMKTTKLKKGANFVEDDTKREQHISTAMGYGLWMSVMNYNRKSKVIKL